MQTDDSHFTVRLARDEADILAAQRLRYEVFVAELGGAGPLVDHQRRLERDRFDVFFDHIVLVDDRRAAGDHVVGVYRVMRSDQALRAGQFYSDDEFDLSRLRASGRRLLELGRSCLHAEYRGGIAMHHIWRGLADYVFEHEIEILFGVASFHGTDAAALAEPLSYLHHSHLAPPDLRVRVGPRHAQRMDLMPPEAIDRARAMRATPALIKAYLRLGGCVGEGAFLDHAFNTTDVCLVLDTTRMTARSRALYAGARA